MSEWIDICAKSDVESDDLITLDHAGHRYAIYHSESGEFFCTDGKCTHEDVDLGDGLVMDFEIECPKHNARFDFRTGEAKCAPACVNLQTYAIRENGDRLEIQVD